ncbi:MAG: hypothetical protein JSR97_07440 [Verrucomicrobia bacterium]|nr:hypothetical protein [Verrucomicrobiota bacterium]
MRITIALFISLLIFLSSWGQTVKDSKKAFEFYDLVNKQIALGKPSQQEFIDKLTTSLLTIKENKNALIDTRELQTLFDFAKATNEERQKELEKISEFDTDLNYKGITMDYFKSYNGLYENEIPKAIKIFVEQSEDRFERVGNLLMPKLKITKQKELALKQAQNDFKAKYESLSKTEPKRTGSDYEFIKLKDFKFTATTIKEGTKLELLSYSGGDDLLEENIYYKQFIGIDKTNGDTLRVLALAQMQHYNLNKALRIGTYTTDLPVRSQMTPSDKEYIIFNTNQADIEKGNYKTVFGILKFDE